MTGLCTVITFSLFRAKGPIVYYVLGGARGGGCLKNRVYENFTPQKIFQAKGLPPTAMTV